jgi:hypothetical protein
MQGLERRRLAAKTLGGVAMNGALYANGDVPFIDSRQAARPAIA